MQSFVDALWALGAGSIFAPITAGTLYVDEYQTPVLSSDSWGNAYSQSLVAPTPTTQDALPLQNAIVVSRQTLDQELPQTRSYNRSFVGPLQVGVLDSDGRIDSSRADNIRDVFVALDNDLRNNVPLLTGVPGAYEGLCNASYRGTPPALGPAQIASTDRLWVGLTMDTQRRRRNKVFESRANEVVIPGGTSPTSAAVGRLRVT